MLGVPKLEKQVEAAAANIRTDVPPVRIIARSRVREPHHLVGLLGKLIQCIDDRSCFHLERNRTPEIAVLWRELLIEDEIAESAEHAVRRFVRKLGGWHATIQGICWIGPCLARPDPGGISNRVPLVARIRCYHRIDCVRCVQQLRIDAFVQPDVLSPTNRLKADSCMCCYRNASQRFP